MHKAMLDRRNSTLNDSREQRDLHSRPLSLLEPGQIVLAQDDKTERWSTTGTIKSRRDDSRSYVVEFTLGPRNYAIGPLSMELTASPRDLSAPREDSQSALPQSQDVGQKATNRDNS